ncbi:hypothetical protein WJX75_004672 [Coccomyxa subellipsoidea]|uniref:Uncharacterized protein n=1 Tax=Coccomyxa subellipsoidea TaxID=248742 RepID=A0ABR2YMI4_9CHLO
MHKGFQAKERLWEMVSKGFAKPDLQHTRFFAVLQEMQQWNIPRSEQSYETEMKVHLYKHDPAAALAVRDQAEAAGIEFAGKESSSLLHALGMSGDMPAAHQVLETLRDKSHNNEREFAKGILLGWHARRGEVDDAEQVFKSLAVQTSATAHALAEAALQHWRQSSSAAENPLAASIIRSCTGAKAEDRQAFNLRRFCMKPHRRWMRGQSGKMLLNTSRDYLLRAPNGHWMTQLSFLEALQALLEMKESSRIQLFETVKGIQVATSNKHAQLGLSYKRPPLMMTLLKLMQNLGISSCLHETGHSLHGPNIVTKPQEILSFVQSAQQKGQRIDAATFRDCLVGLEPV